jgi:hypothetical protein
VKRVRSPAPEFEKLRAREVFPVDNGVRTALAMGNSVYFVIQPITGEAPPRSSGDADSGSHFGSRHLEKLPEMRLIRPLLGTF